MSETPPPVPPVPPAPNNNTAPPPVPNPPTPPLEPVPKKNEPATDENGDPIYEMLWKCAFCGSDKLLAKSQRFCRSCGAPQDPKNRYFPSEEEWVAVQNSEYQGADKTCPACSTPNSGKSTFCTQCGSAMDGSKTVQLKQDPDDLPPPEEPKKRSGCLILVVFALLLGITFFIVNYFWRETVVLELTKAEWQREVKIEQFQADKDSSWCSSLPAQAYSVSKKSEVKETKKVPDGETCKTKKVDKGDGSFVAKKECEPKYREEPVYADKCYYTINRWKYNRSIKSQGTDKQPKDPDVVLTKTGNNCLGCEREAARIGKYVLTLTNKKAKSKEPIVCEVKEQIWQQANPDAKFKMEQSVMTDSIHCDSLKVTK